MGEQENPVGARLVDTAGDGPAEDTLEQVIDLEGRSLGQVLQVVARETTTAGRYQAQDLIAQALMPGSIGGQHLIQFILGQFGDPGRVR